MFCRKTTLYFHLGVIFLISLSSADNPEEAVIKSLKSINGKKPLENNSNLTTVTPDQVTFYLYTRGSNAKVINKANVQTVPSKPTIIVTHGYTDNSNLTWIQNITQTYLQKGDYNVITVDWHVPAFLDYATSARNTRPVGNLIGELAVKLNKEKKISLNDFHLIGHSLGAHVMGFAGKKIKEQSGSKVRWITGLDPARPLFEEPKQPKQNRLSDEDGEIVECLHTDGGVNGFITPLGTIDFFANGGTAPQPNCTIPATIPDTLKEIQQYLSCSHQKAPWYYIYAVENKKGVAARKCSSYSQYKTGACKGNKKEYMGGNLKPDDKGSYYFDLVV